MLSTKREPCHHYHPRNQDHRKHPGDKHTQFLDHSEIKLILYTEITLPVHEEPLTLTQEFSGLLMVGAMQPMFKKQRSLQHEYVHTFFRDIPTQTSPPI
jgi:hypothetical protein